MNAMSTPAERFRDDVLSHGYRPPTRTIDQRLLAGEYVSREELFASCRHCGNGPASPDGGLCVFCEPDCEHSDVERVSSHPLDQRVRCADCHVEMQGDGPDHDGHETFTVKP